MGLEFTKWHGLGNDFILVESQPDGWTPEKVAALAAHICDRHFGIGGDGLIFVYRDEDGQVNMRIFNADGSEPEMCGNGLRCAAMFAYQRGLADGLVFPIKTKAGVMVPEIILDGGRSISGAGPEYERRKPRVPANGRGARRGHSGDGGRFPEVVRVDMGEPVFRREQIPVHGTPGTRMIEEEIRVDDDLVTVTAVSMGNPHCLVFVTDVAGAPVHDLGPRLERNVQFPNRVNVEFIEVRGDEEIAVRVWERGVGETLACGTGACAAVAGSALTGRTGRRVRVNLPGGQLLIEWADNNHIYMTGPAVEVFRGELCEDLSE